jgi:hypothetical protein
LRYAALFCVLCFVRKLLILYPGLLTYHNREELKEYWQKVISIDKITDFAKHHCSLDIKAFLEIEENTQNKVYFAEIVRGGLIVFV